MFCGRAQVLGQIAFSRRSTNPEEDKLVLGDKSEKVFLRQIDPSETAELVSSPIGWNLA